MDTPKASPSQPAKCQHRILLGCGFWLCWLPASAPSLQGCSKGDGPAVGDQTADAVCHPGDSQSFADDKTNAVINSSSHSRLLPGLSPGTVVQNPLPAFGASLDAGMGCPWQEGERHPVPVTSRYLEGVLAWHPLTDTPKTTTAIPYPHHPPIPASPLLSITPFLQHPIAAASPSSPASHSSSIPLPSRAPSPRTHLSAAPLPLRPVPALRTRGRPAGKGREGAGSARHRPQRRDRGGQRSPRTRGSLKSLFLPVTLPRIPPRARPGLTAAGARGRGGAGGALGALRDRGRRRVQMRPRLLGRGSGAAPGVRDGPGAGGPAAFVRHRPGTPPGAGDSWRGLRGCPAPVGHQRVPAVL